MRILQITDCHLLSQVDDRVYGADTYRSLSLVLEAAFGLDEPPQLVLATGDLSEDGSPGSYERLRELLLASGVPVYVIAGNHDSIRNMQRFLLGGPVSMEAHVDIGSWRIIFLNSKVESEAFGLLGGSELGRLAQALEEEPDRPAVVCLHHSPISPCPSTGCQLRNERQFLDVIESHGNARAVLAGHAHVELARPTRTALLLTTPATSSQCLHAQLGARVDHEDFWASHKFEPMRHGFRMLHLHTGGTFDTRVHWISDDTV